jgi:fatty-acid desaturase
MYKKNKSIIIHDKYKLIFFQFIAHIGLLALVFFGTWHHWLITSIIYVITGCFGITMTYHRYLSHKSWNGPVWWEKFGSLCGFFGLVGSPIAWVATHRMHHRSTDKPDDPHSPVHRPWWRVQWFSMLDSANPRYAVDLLRNQFQLYLHKNYFTIHLFIFLVLGLYDPMLLLCAYLAPAAILWNAGSFINTITHLHGYKNFETKDNSRCNLFLGYFVFGEGWHNNHHADIANPNFKVKWWEFDLGFTLIKLLRKN